MTETLLRERPATTEPDLAATMAEIGRRARAAAAALASRLGRGQGRGIARCRAGGARPGGRDPRRQCARPRRGGEGLSPALRDRLALDPQAGRGDRRGARGDRRIARPGRPRARPLDAAERARDRARRRAARRHRHHLREPAQRHRRCRRVGTQIRQCRDPARRLGELPFVACAGRGLARGAAQRRPARGRDPAGADARPRRGRADARR